MTADSKPALPETNSPAGIVVSDACSAPLRAQVVGGLLVISIGVETLAWASHPENGGKLKGCRIEPGRETEFAKDVVSEIARDREDGETPLECFLDRMIVAAADNGSGALIFPKSNAQNDQGRATQGAEKDA